MRRLRTLVLVAAAGVGLVVGVFSVLAASDAVDSSPAAPANRSTGSSSSGHGSSGGTSEGDSSSAPSPPDGGRSVTSTSQVESPPPVGSASPAARPNVLMAWTSGGLPADFGERVDSIGAVEYSSVVLGDQASMVRSRRSGGAVVDEPTTGWMIPLDTLAVRPDTYSRFIGAPDAAAVAGLEPGEALLTRTSMDLRDLDVGSVIELSTGPVFVAGVIDDHSGAGAELIVHADDADRLGVSTPRHVLVSFAPDARREVTAAMAPLAGNKSIRFRTPAETTWLRYGDAVAPQVLLKQRFGEFAFRDLAGRSVEIDPAWVEQNVVSADVPLLGTVRCHRLMIEPLSAALGALEEANLAHLVDPGGFAGCWSPRRIGENLPLSRHAWGVAVDLNIGANPRGSFSTQDPRLIEAMRSVGLENGGRWLVPDPGHYEIAVDP